MADTPLIRMDPVPTASLLPESPDPERPEGFAGCFNAASFGNRHGRNVPEDTSFTMPERPMAAIAGRLGSKKSTILNPIPRFWDASCGQIGSGGPLSGGARPSPAPSPGTSIVLLDEAMAAIDPGE